MSNKTKNTIVNVSNFIKLHGIQFKLGPSGGDMIFHNIESQLTSHWHLKC